MTISVIVPVFNVKGFLGECVRSVLDEADSGVELVCVDDGSVDGSGDLIDEIAHGEGKGVVKAVRQEHAGVGAARNAGLAVASGDLVMFVDGDDVLAPGWLAVVRVLAARHPSAQMLGFGRTETLPVKPVAARESREVDVSRILDMDVFERGLWQFAYRREAIAGLGFERLVRGEDKLFQGAALLRASHVAVMDVPVYGYRQREGSAVHSALSRESFGAEIAWRVKWLEAMTAAGKTMDRRLWRYLGLCFLEYIPHFLREVDDAALRRDMEGLLFNAMRGVSAYPFAPWQRTAMLLLGVTKSRAAAWVLCRLPYAVKHTIHFGTPG